ncbi:hypothetical protein J4209_06350 [Candidatus Woesearchaeota archaeon]|nr:hypothetical protein [Candidatus Woesearchaeota archaeon]
MVSMSSEWYFRNWAELFFFILLIVGFLISLAAPSAVISYIVIFVAGMMAGRLIYEKKKKFQFPYYLIVVGFFIGFLIGARYGNKKVILTLFVLGTLISYFVHEKGIVKDIRF